MIYKNVHGTLYKLSVIVSIHSKLEDFIKTAKLKKTTLFTSSNRPSLKTSLN